MRDLNTALEEHLCHVAETQLVAQTPQHREEHHVGRDLKMVEWRAGSLVEATLARAAVEPPVAERRARLASGRGGGCTVRTVHRCLLVHAQTRLNLTVRALRSDAAFGEYQRQVSHIVMLRAFRDDAHSVPSLYQLVEIPTSIFDSIQATSLVVFSSDAPAVPCTVNGETVAVVALDRSDAKVTVRGIRIDACTVHAEWRQA